MDSRSYLCTSEPLIVQASIIRTQAPIQQLLATSLATGDGSQDTVSSFWMQVTSRTVTLRPHRDKQHNSIVAEVSRLLGCYATPSGKVTYVSTDCSAFFFRDKQPNESVFQKVHSFLLTKDIEADHSSQLGAAGDKHNTHIIYTCRYNSLHAK